MVKKTGLWGSSRSVRLEAECRELGIGIGDEVEILVVDGKITIEKVITEFKVVNGVKFSVKE